MKAVTLEALTAKLEKVQHLNPTKFKALDTIVDMVLRDEKATASAARGVSGRLLSRLQARHECRQPESDRGFEQLEPVGKARRWKCLGCGLEVTLD